MCGQRGVHGMGACMGGMCDERAYMVGGMHSRGHAW